VTQRCFVVKFTILGELVADRIIAAVPRDYHERVRMSTEKGATYTVVLFAHARGDVVTSALVRKALRRVPPESPLLAIGADFTHEATILLEERNARVARIGEFGWTDESWASLPR
jgi:hypothetical protein